MGTPTAKPEDRAPSGKTRGLRPERARRMARTGGSGPVELERQTAQPRLRLPRRTAPTTIRASAGWANIDESRTSCRGFAGSLSPMVGTGPEGPGSRMGERLEGPRPLGRDRGPRGDCRRSGSGAVLLPHQLPFRAPTGSSGGVDAAHRRLHDRGSADLGELVPSGADRSAAPRRGRPRRRGPLPLGPRGRGARHRRDDPGVPPGRRARTTRGPGVEDPRQRDHPGNGGKRGP